MGGQSSISDDVEVSSLAPTVYPYRVTADWSLNWSHVGTPWCYFTSVSTYLIYSDPAASWCNCPVLPCFYFHLVLVMLIPITYS